MAVINLDTLLLLSPLPLLDAATTPPSYSGPNTPILRRFLGGDVILFYFVVVMVVVFISGRRQSPSTQRPHCVEITGQLTAGEGPLKSCHVA